MRGWSRSSFPSVQSWVRDVFAPKGIPSSQHSTVRHDREIAHTRGSHRSPRSVLITPATGGRGPPSGGWTAARRSSGGSDAGSASRRTHTHRRVTVRRHGTAAPRHSPAVRLRRRVGPVGGATLAPGEPGGLEGRVRLKLAEVDGRRGNRGHGSKGCDSRHRLHLSSTSGGPRRSWTSTQRAECRSARQRRQASAPRPSGQGRGDNRTGAAAGAPAPRPRSREAARATLVRVAVGWYPDCESRGHASDRAREGPGASGAQERGSTPWRSNCGRGCWRTSRSTPW